MEVNELADVISQLELNNESYNPTKASGRGNKKQSDLL